MAGRVHDAMRWVAQESRALLAARRVDDRRRMLAQAIDLLDEAYLGADPTAIGAALERVAQVARALQVGGYVDERGPSRLREARHALAVAYTTEAIELA